MPVIFIDKRFAFNFTTVQSISVIFRCKILDSDEAFKIVEKVPVGQEPMIYPLRFFENRKTYTLHKDWDAAVVRLV